MAPQWATPLGGFLVLGRLAQCLFGSIARRRQLPLGDLDIFCEQVALIHCPAVVCLQTMRGRIALLRARPKPRMPRLRQHTFQTRIRRRKVGIRAFQQSVLHCNTSKFRLSGGKTPFQLGNVFGVDRGGGRHDQLYIDTYNPAAKITAVSHPAAGYPASFGCRRRTVRTAFQSNPSNSAENCAGVSLITPSVGRLNFNFVRYRFLY